MNRNKVVLLPGDHTGREIMAQAVRVLNVVAPELEAETHRIGGSSIDAYGVPLTEDVLETCRQAGAVLLGAIGGPKWESNNPDDPRPEQGLLDLREGLGVYANLRPVRPEKSLYDISPLKRKHIEGTDLLIVRELTGGIYFGDKGPTDDGAYDTCEYTIPEIERIARVAFRAARIKVTSVDMADVIETSRLWREVVTDIHDREFPEVQLEHVLMGKAVKRLMKKPSDFDVILADNLFGDILSDEAAAISGSIGLLPSASLGEPGTPGLFEPVHGSAPDIAGKGIANPLAMFLSAAMMLRHGLGRKNEANTLEAAVDHVLDIGLRTPDLGGQASTVKVADEVLRYLESEPPETVSSRV